MFSPQPLFITELVHEDFTSSDILAFSGADKKKTVSIATWLMLF